MPKQKASTKKVANKTVAKAVKKAVRKIAKKAAPKKPKKVTAKKAAKKTAKKVAKKNSKTTRKQPGKSLAVASNSTSFWVSDGQVLNNLVALRDAFDAMEAKVYKYHAADENDFANWVEVVLRDENCAADLRMAKTKRGAKTVVVKHLKYYSI